MRPGPALVPRREAQEGMISVAIPTMSEAALAIGAVAARGSVLVLMHADSGFPPGSLVTLKHLLRQRPEVAGGNSCLLLDGQGGFSRRLNGLHALIRRLGFWYGGSGTFIRRAVHDATGGVRPQAPREDYDLVRRLRRAGPTARVTRTPLVTSSCRFAGRSPPAIVRGWIAMIHPFYRFGVPTSSLARLYDSEHRRG